MKYDLAVIGAGFYGCMLALHEAEQGKSVLLVEEEADIMTKASMINQAIVHRGYHYPRSERTVVSSNANYERFKKEFKSAIYEKHTKYHAISKKASFVTADEYEAFYNKLGIPLKRVTSPSPLLEAMFETPEASFNFKKIRSLIKKRLLAAKVHLCYNSCAFVHADNSVTITRTWDKPSYNVGDAHFISADRIAVCVYADMPRMQDLNLKYQFTEMVLVDLPESWALKGVTVMDGPFFSITPWPADKCHVMSHVVHTVHAQWTNEFIPNYADVGLYNRTHFEFMKKAAVEYFPELKDMKYRKSLYSTKALLPASCHDDGRPILIKTDGHISYIVGSKIDNVYDMLDAWDGKETAEKNVLRIT